MSLNPFVLDVKEYRRDLNIKQTYFHDQALHLSMMEDIPYAEALTWVQQQVSPTGPTPFESPKIFYGERIDYEDRIPKEGDLESYLNFAITNHDLISPIMTTYIHPKIRQSILVDYIDGNIKARSKAKGLKFKYKQAGNKVLALMFDNEQNNRKLANNAISGAHVSPSQPMYNPSAHTTLTSNCRATSGYGNANNEKLLSGNRHYYAPDIVLNNIISIVNLCDYPRLQGVMDRHGLHYPTPEEAMTCVEYSMRLYWHDRRDLANIREVLTRLTPIQRAAFVYTGDLYQVLKYNEVFFRDFMTKMITQPLHPHHDPAAIMANTAVENTHLGTQILNDLMKGKKLEKVAKEEPALYGLLGAVVAQIEHVSADYADFIGAIMVTRSMPASLAYFPESIRRSAVTSDTDSTIFTVQDWVEWYCGNIVFTPDALGVQAVMVWFSANSIVHILAMMSANFGIEQARIHQTAMKNEYRFDVFAPTSVAKHYFALKGCQEGDIFAEYEKEIKGVHLRSSNVPTNIIQEAEAFMTRIMNTVLEGRKLNLYDTCKYVANLEREVFANIEKGNVVYFRRMQIKEASSYTKGETQSNYLHYPMWQEVFAPVYGKIPPPPYSAQKVSVALDTPIKFKAWLKVLATKDPGMAKRMEAYSERIGRTSWSTWYLPTNFIETHGIPAEFHDAVRIRQMVLDTTKVFKLIMEVLSIYVESDYLFSDDY